MGKEEVLSELFLHLLYMGQKISSKVDKLSGRDISIFLRLQTLEKLGEII